MSVTSHYIGQRLSLRDELCTVRYIGRVDGKQGDWLGVEWQDEGRGKHDGSNGGSRYFECRSPSPTAASFLRPQQAWDSHSSFLNALHAKYMLAPESASPLISFGSKQAEEVGFDQFSQRQKHLRGIHTIVLDHMRIRIGSIESESREIMRLCGHVTELDLSDNLLESMDELASLLTCLPVLNVLTLDGNHLCIAQEPPSATFRTVQVLSLSRTLLNWNELTALMRMFPSLRVLNAAQNNLQTITTEPFPETLHHVNLSDNPFTSLFSVSTLFAAPVLTTLVLRRCSIADMGGEKASTDAVCPSQTVETLDLRDNHLVSWRFLDDLQRILPQLKHFQISGNRFRELSIPTDNKSAMPLLDNTLTLARLPQLETLNHSKITEKDRWNAETSYLKQISFELSLAPTERHAEILQQHPRWAELCREYGEPPRGEPAGLKHEHLNTLAARLVAVSFSVAAGSSHRAHELSWHQDIPKSFSVYSIMGIVGKKLGLAPYDFRLVAEISESQSHHYPDDHQRSMGQDSDWWDSDDEDDVGLTKLEDPISRGVDLHPGTRSIGSYLDGQEARIRVEILVSGKSTS